LIRRRAVVVLWVKALSSTFTQAMARAKKRPTLMGFGF
jgi:hypothetical protein